MGDRNRFFLLIAIMAIIGLSSTFITISLLYRAALIEERERLTETATSQARLIEAVARFDQKYSRSFPEGHFAATIHQIRDAHEKYKGFGETGEFTLARREGNKIVFLLSHRHYDLNNPKPISFDSNLAVPMKLALSGDSGTIIGADYRGKEVLAAYEPVKVLDLGIVAKLDMEEIKAPFIRAGLISMAAIIALILIGAAFFIKISRPIIRRLEEQNEELLKEIMERNRSEETLKEHEIFLSTLIDAIPLPVFYKDKDGRYLGFNKAFENFFAQSSDQLVGKTAFDIVSPELAEIYHAKDKLLFEMGGTQQYEAEVENANGDLRDVVFNKAVFEDKLGDIAGLIGTITDITEDKRAEKERREREQLLNEMGKIAKIGAWEHDLIDRKAVWTKEIYKIVEIDPSDPIPGPDEHFSYYPPEDREILEEAYRHAIDTGEQFDLELRCTTAKGRHFWARAIGRPEFKEGRCVKMKGTFQDITEKKALENRIFQIQKMESIGNLAGGVAHDYNNMLSIIIGYAESILEKLDPENPIYDDISEILEAGKRSSDITRQLLAFARQQTTAPKVLDLNDKIKSILKMLRRLIGEDLDLAWRPGAKVWPVKIDPSQIDQILANLCVNARDAIKGVGQVTIETKNISFDEEYCANHAGFIPGEYIMLAVSDNGSGMAPETMDKIFEPFFTTKRLHQGTGLGLSTVYGIVKQNDGFLNVYSEPEKGTTIKCYLPRHTGQTVDPYRIQDSEIPLSRGETILLVEDDKSILKLGKKMLHSLGYTVLSASAPNEAISIAERHSNKIDLLITDVIMPEMNGRELSEQLQEKYPNLKTLYMSGYTANVIAHRGVLEDGVFFIPKPLSKKELSQKIREALDNNTD